MKGRQECPDCRGTGFVVVGVGALYPCCETPPYPTAPAANQASFARGYGEPNPDGDGPSTAAAPAPWVGGGIHPAGCGCPRCWEDEERHAWCAEADAHDSYLTAIEGGW